MPFNANYSYKNWNGTNGKIELFGGFPRIKWNSFTAFVVSSKTGYNKFDIWSIYPTPPYGPNAPVMEQDVFSWNPYPSLSEMGGVTSNQQNKAFQKLLTKIKGHEFNLGVEAGQMNQTVRLLSENLVKLGRSALALRRGDFSTAARQLGARPRSTNLKGKDISGRWLELQYGWLPLLSSSYESMLAFKAISDGPRTKLFRASSVETRDYELSQSPTLTTAQVKVKVGRRLQYEMYEELSVPRQLGLFDPLSVAWELTPWSFVIDWFFPFGNYLSNLNQIPRLQGRWLVTDFGKCEPSKFTARYIPKVWQGFRPIVAVTQSPSGEVRFTSMTRTFSASPPPVPLPKFSIYGISSTRRFWNAVSLAHQRFLK
jgi:hypothetical protein